MVQCRVYIAWNQNDHEYFDIRKMKEISLEFRWPQEIILHTWIRLCQEIHHCDTGCNGRLMWVVWHVDSIFGVESGDVTSIATVG